MGTGRVAEGPGAPGATVVELVDWFRQLASSEGSDLHIKVGSPPAFREGGRVRRLEHPPLGTQETEALAGPVRQEGEGDQDNGG